MNYRHLCAKCGARRIDRQLGLDSTPEEYVAKMVAVFREVRRVLRDDGTLWLNLGDSYAQSGMGGNPAESEYRKQATNAGSLVHGRTPPHGLKPKDLVGIPWRVAFALQADGWYLRSDIIWSKPNPMPESVRDRPTKAHEYLFLLSKRERYWYDAEAIAEPALMGTDLGILRGRSFADPSKVAWHAESIRKRQDAGVDSRTAGDGSRNRRSVWHIVTQPYPEAHFAVMPENLVVPCVLAGCPSGGTVLDPFAGAGTVGVVACKLGRDFIGCELNPEYVEMAERRIEPYAAQMTMGVV